MFKKAEIEINMLHGEDVITVSISMPDPGDWMSLLGEEDNEK